MCLLTLPNISWGSKLPLVENDYADAMDKKKGLMWKELVKISNTADERAIYSNATQNVVPDEEPQHHLGPC